MKYQKRPLTVEAMQFDGSKESANRILDWAGPESGMELIFTSLRAHHPNVLLVHTLEGVVRALKTSWIIRGISGEFYPCKNDIFQAAYERVEE